MAFLFTFVLFLILHKQITAEIITEATEPLPNVFLATGSKMLKFSDPAISGIIRFSDFPSLHPVLNDNMVAATQISSSGLEFSYSPSVNGRGLELSSSQTVINTGLEILSSQTVINTGLEILSSQTVINTGLEILSSQTVINTGLETSYSTSLVEFQMYYSSAFIIETISEDLLTETMEIQKGLLKFNKSSLTQSAIQYINSLTQTTVLLLAPTSPLIQIVNGVRRTPLEQMAINQTFTSPTILFRSEFTNDFITPLKMLEQKQSLNEFTDLVKSPRTKQSLIESADLIISLKTQQSTAAVRVNTDNITEEIPTIAVPVNTDNIIEEIPTTAVPVNTDNITEEIPRIILEPKMLSVVDLANSRGTAVLSLSETLAAFTSIFQTTFAVTKVSLGLTSITVLENSASETLEHAAFISALTAVIAELPPMRDHLMVLTHGMMEDSVLWATRPKRNSFEQGGITESTQTIFASSETFWQSSDWSQYRSTTQVAYTEQMNESKKEEAMAEQSSVFRLELVTDVSENEERMKSAKLTDESTTEKPKGTLNARHIMLEHFITTSPITNTSFISNGDTAVRDTDAVTSLRSVINATPTKNVNTDFLYNDLRSTVKSSFRNENVQNVTSISSVTAVNTITTIIDDFSTIIYTTPDYLYKENNTYASSALGSKSDLGDPSTSSRRNEGQVTFLTVESGHAEGFISTLLEAVPPFTTFVLFPTPVYNPSSLDHVSLLHTNASVSLTHTNSSVSLIHTNASVALSNTFSVTLLTTDITAAQTQISFPLTTSSPSAEKSFILSSILLSESLPFQALNSSLISSSVHSLSSSYLSPASTLNSIILNYESAYSSSEYTVVTVARPLPYIKTITAFNNTPILSANSTSTTVATFATINMSNTNSTDTTKPNLLNITTIISRETKSLVSPDDTTLTSPDKTPMTSLDETTLVSKVISRASSPTTIATFHMKTSVNKGLDHTIQPIVHIYFISSNPSHLMSSVKLSVQRFVVNGYFSIRPNNEESKKPLLAGRGLGNFNTGRRLSHALSRLVYDYMQWKESHISKESLKQIMTPKRKSVC